MPDPARNAVSPPEEQSGALPDATGRSRRLQSASHALVHASTCSSITWIGAGSFLFRVSDRGGNLHARHRLRSRPAYPWMALKPLPFPLQYRRPSERSPRSVPHPPGRGTDRACACFRTPGWMPHCRLPAPWLDGKLRRGHVPLVAARPASTPEAAGDAYRQWSYLQLLAHSRRADPRRGGVGQHRRVRYICKVDSTFACSRESQQTACWPHRSMPISCIIGHHLESLDGWR